MVDERSDRESTIHCRTLSFRSFLCGVEARGRGEATWRTSPRFAREMALPRLTPYARGSGGIKVYQLSTRARAWAIKKAS